MQLNTPTKYVLSFGLAAIATFMATRSDFYTTALSSAFFAIALIGVTIILFRVRPAWPDALYVLLGTAVIAVVDFRLLGFKPQIMAWFSFVGLSSLLVLAIRVVWAEEVHRKLLLLAFAPSLLFVASEWFASTFLEWTEKAHPQVLDLYLYSFDASLHVQFPFLLGQLFSRWQWFRLVCLLFYIGLPIPIALIYVGQLLRDRTKALPAMLAFLLTGPIGILFYNFYPALGPVHIFLGSFPWQPLTTVQAAQLFLEPVNAAGPRNAIPSLHMGWMLLVWWYSKGLSWWERGLALLFLIFTVFATMGTGEHYFIDLIVAFPFAVFVQGLCAYGLPWKEPRRLAALLGGLLATLAWLAALRYGVRAFWISPVVPWVLCAATVGLTIFLKNLLLQDQAVLPAKG